VRRVIAGDIGGTKTLLRCIEPDGVVSAQQRYDSASFRTFDELLRVFLTHVPGPVTAACFAVAGPVVLGRAELTNLSWTMDESALGRAFAIPYVSLINDFYGIALGVPMLGDHDFLVLHNATRDRTAPIGILGAGTGLGEAMVTFQGDRWTVVPGEGGHADFAPQDEEQARLFLSLRERYGGHVSWERLLSGMGLENIYEFLTGREEEPARIAAMATQGDPAAIRTFDIFVDIYGSEAGNMALRILARGGIFLAGGIAAKNVPFFTDGRFVRAYLRKGRFRELLETMPVYLITNEQVGLLGAVEQARRVGA
jgi:glucokinase